MPWPLGQIITAFKHAEPELGLFPRLLSGIAFVAHAEGPSAVSATQLKCPDDSDFGIDFKLPFDKTQDCTRSLPAHPPTRIRHPAAIPVRCHRRPPQPPSAARRNRAARRLPPHTYVRLIAATPPADCLRRPPMDSLGVRDKGRPLRRYSAVGWPSAGLAVARRLGALLGRTNLPLPSAGLPSPSTHLPSPPTHSPLTFHRHLPRPSARCATRAT